MAALRTTTPPSPPPAPLATPPSQPGHPSSWRQRVGSWLGNATLPPAWLGNATLSRPVIGANVAVRPSVWSLRSGTALTHVVSTRFSLGQGNQTALVEARLHLLFALCVPSMVQQLRDARFVWLIYHDSTLASNHVAAITARLQRLAGGGFRFVRERVEGQFSRSAQEQLELVGLWTPPPVGAKVIYVASRLDADDGLPRGALPELHPDPEPILAPAPVSCPCPYLTHPNPGPDQVPYWSFRSARARRFRAAALSCPPPSRA